MLLVDRVGKEGIGRIRDDQPIRVADGVVYAVLPDGQDRGARHRPRRRPRAGAQRDGPGPQRRWPSSWTRSRTPPATSCAASRSCCSTAAGCPTLTTRLAGRPVVVVGAADHADLQAIGPFVREQAPVVIAVGAAADDLLGLSWAPDVVVVTAGDPGSVPSADALRVAADVVLVAPRGSEPRRAGDDRGRRRPALLVDTSATAEDIALLLADRYAAALIVGVGLHARLEEFLDGQQAGRASSFATRLKVGDRLVDAAAVPGALHRPARRAPGGPGAARGARGPARGDRRHPGRPGLGPRRRRLPPGARVISLRQHVASLVAVFLALAVGIALGGGLLADTDDDATTSRSATSQPRSRRRPRTSVATFADAFAGAGAARLYANGLDGHAAAILTMPGAETAQVKALQAQIIAAGGAITGTFTAGDKLVDADERRRRHRRQPADHPARRPAGRDHRADLRADGPAPRRRHGHHPGLLGARRPRGRHVRAEPGRRRAAHLAGGRPQRSAGARRAAARGGGRASRAWPRAPSSPGWSTESATTPRAWSWSATRTPPTRASSRRCARAS